MPSAIPKPSGPVDDVADRALVDSRTRTSRVVGLTVPRAEFQIHRSLSLIEASAELIAQALERQQRSRR